MQSTLPYFYLLVSLRWTAHFALPRIVGKFTFNLKKEKKSTEPDFIAKEESVFWNISTLTFLRVLVFFSEFLFSFWIQKLLKDSAWPVHSSLLEAPPSTNTRVDSAGRAPLTLRPTCMEPVSDKDLLRAAIRSFRVWRFLLVLLLRCIQLKR